MKDFDDTNLHGTTVKNKNFRLEFYLSFSFSSKSSFFNARVLNKCLRIYNVFVPAIKKHALILNCINNIIILFINIIINNV
jgi:hypothetical protein